jgi:DNA-binding protein HU-beta
MQQNLEPERDSAIFEIENHVQLKSFFMNKSELIDAMAQDADISKGAAKKALDSFTEHVAGSLAKGNRVSLVGFGTFSTSERSAREGRNPQTGQKIQIPAKTVAKFKPGSELNDKL